MSTTAPTDLARERDLRGRFAHVWYRRAVLTVLAGIVALAFTGVFGERHSERVAANDHAELRVNAPKALRGGLMTRVRVEVRAKQRIENPTIVLGPGFIDNAQLNSLEPIPSSESTRPPRAPDQPAALAFGYPTLDAGETLTVYLQLQTNPGAQGKQDMSVSVEGDDLTPLRSPQTVLAIP